MTKQVLIHNKSSRGFYLRGGVFLAVGEKIAVSEDEAGLLVNLYPDEIESMESLIKQFQFEKNDEAAEEVDYSTFKVADLKEILEKAGVEIPEGSKKADLVEMVQNLEHQEAA